jgi:hypothetical protein
MLFSHWYTSPTPSVEGASNLSRSATAAATFWLALAKAGSFHSACSPPWPGSPSTLIHVEASRLAWPPWQPTRQRACLDAARFFTRCHPVGVPSFLWMSRQLLREGCWCSGPLRRHPCGQKCRGLLRRCSCEGVTGIIVLYTLKRGEPKLSPSLKAESSSLGDSSRMACSDGDSLWAMPPNATPELAPFG